ncbi:hypothetical protein ILYODFUR_027355, partial [Ilyodon furcidens]
FDAPYTVYVFPEVAKHSKGYLAPSRTFVLTCGPASVIPNFLWIYGFHSHDWLPPCCTTCPLSTAAVLKRSLDSTSATGKQTNYSFTCIITSNNLLLGFGTIFLHLL